MYGVFKCLSQDFPRVTAFIILGFKGSLEIISLHNQNKNMGKNNNCMGTLCNIFKIFL